MNDIQEGIRMHKPIIAGTVAFAALVGMSAGACSSTADHPTTGTGGMDASTSAGGPGGQGSASTSSFSGGGGDSGTPMSCKPDCTGKTCGDDGCNGTCGGCPPSQLC